MHFIIVLILNENVGAGLEYFIPQYEDQFLVCFDAEVPKVINIKQHHLLPAAESVLILYEILFHGIFDVWENRNDFVESFLSDVTDIAITLGFDCGSPSIV